ncbi:hypothetical protein V8C26DRAFT_72952 [Trichoderma gracile]
MIRKDFLFVRSWTSCVGLVRKSTCIVHNEPIAPPIKCMFSSLCLSVCPSCKSGSRFCFPSTAFHGTHTHTHTHAGRTTYKYMHGQIDGRGGGLKGDALFVQTHSTSEVLLSLCALISALAPPFLSQLHITDRHTIRYDTMRPRYGMAVRYGSKQVHTYIHPYESNNSTDEAATAAGKGWKGGGRCWAAYAPLWSHACPPCRLSPAFLSFLFSCSAGRTGPGTGTGSCTSKEGTAHQQRASCWVPLPYYYPMQIIYRQNESERE